MNLLLSALESPLGTLLVVTDTEQRIRALGFGDYRLALLRNLRQRFGDYRLQDTPLPRGIADALRGYFQGDLGAIDCLVLEPDGTPFQRKVWDTLQQIPPGSTRSYGEVARQLGLNDPRAAIEVGAANAANPIAVLIPCHRVVASNGELRGYAWGLERKHWLLEHERALRPLAATPRTASLPGF